MIHLVDPILEEAAGAFWMGAGEREGCPVDLARAVALSLPLDVVAVSRLTIGRVEEWLMRRGVAYGFDDGDRPLYGLLVVYRGAGFIFLDGSDDEPTRRFTLAHETAHYLLDYLRHRRSAVRRLGDGVLDVLDGLRPPTPDERLAAALTDVEIKAHVHLLARADDAAAWQVRVGQAEEQADRLALELLAPAAEIAAAVRDAGAGANFFRCAAEAEGLLRGAYGLPSLIASGYARRLARAITGGPSLLTALAPK
jgi:hypothetical protein